MRTSRIAIASVCGMATLLCLQQVLTSEHSQSFAKEPPAAKSDSKRAKTDENIVTIPVDGKAKQKSMLPYMHAKLRHSQQVFAGLVTKDFEKIELGAEALLLTALSTPKVEPDRKRNDEVFEHLKLEFVRLSGQLQQMAADKNLEGAAYVSEKLNATCIACHQYLRDELPRIPTAVQQAN